ncbi:hypothetical protein AAMO2058_000625400 [Amorphochlora amoebiformis]
MANRSRGLSGYLFRRFLSTTGSTQPSLAFKIERTRSQNLPIYLDYKKGRTQCKTIVRKYKGDATVLASHIKHVVGTHHLIKMKASTLEVDGDHLDELKKYFEKLGF